MAKMVSSPYKPPARRLPADGLIQQKSPEVSRLKSLLKSRENNLVSESLSKAVHFEQNVQKAYFEKSEFTVRRGSVVELSAKDSEQTKQDRSRRSSIGASDDQNKENAAPVKEKKVTRGRPRNTKKSTEERQQSVGDTNDSKKAGLQSAGKTSSKNLNAQSEEKKALPRLRPRPPRNSVQQAEQNGSTNVEKEQKSNLNAIQQGEVNKKSAEVDSQNKATKETSKQRGFPKIIALKKVNPDRGVANLTKNGNGTRGEQLAKKRHR